MFANIINKIKERWLSIDQTKRRRLAITFVVFIIGLSIVIALLTRTEYVVLYSGLDVYEAGEIYNRLIEMGVDVKMQGDDTILVSKDQEDMARMELAAEGYPETGFSYDLYSDNITISSSEQERKQYLLFQLQDRLQKTIESLDGVDGAIVTMSIPDDNIFTLRDEKEPVTASVVIKLKAGKELTIYQVEAIRSLVSKSVSGLRPENVSIVDTKMNLLGATENNDISASSDMYSLKKSIEGDMQNQLKELLEPIFGAGYVKAAVSVTLDFDQLSTHKIEYSPVIDDEGIVISETEIKDKMENEEVGVENQSSSSSDVTKTYQVNQTTSTLEKSRGAVTDVYASILVNAESIDEAMSERVKSIAANAIGVSADKIELAAIPFVASALPGGQLVDIPEPGFLETVLEYWKLILGVMAVLFTFIVVLSTLRIFSKSAPQKQEQAKQKQIDDAIEEIPVDKNPEVKYKKEIDKFVDKRPDEVANLLRTWIADE